MQPPNDDARAEAQRRCRLSDEEVRMAKELGFKPKSLIKNIPAPSQKWKAPVREWVRALYEKKIGSRALAGGAPAPPAARKQVIEFRNPDYPWPDKPDIPERVMVDPFDEDEDDDDIFGNKWEPPSDADIDDQNILLLRRQCLYRWAGQLIAIAMNELPEVQKVAAFGAVAQPLEMEVPRFREFRRHRIEILHECADLGSGGLDHRPVASQGTEERDATRDISRAGYAMGRRRPSSGGCPSFRCRERRLSGPAVHFRTVSEARQARMSCRGCGAQPFLQQFEKYRFNAAQFEGERSDER